MPSQPLFLAAHLYAIGQSINSILLLYSREKYTWNHITLTNPQCSYPLRDVSFHYQSFTAEKEFSIHELSSSDFLFQLVLQRNYANIFTVFHKFYLHSAFQCQYQIPLKSCVVCDLLHDDSLSTRNFQNVSQNSAMTVKEHKWQT